MALASETSDSHIEWPVAHSPASAIVFAHNEVEIKASPQKVWELLIDCTAWPRWYKHCSDVSILGAQKTLEAKAKFRFRTLRTYFEPEIVVFEPYTSIVWVAKGPVWTSGAHAWSIQLTADGCKVVTEETQKGGLLYLLGWRVRKDLELYHEEWVQALKRLAEST